LASEWPAQVGLNLHGLLSSALVRMEALTSAGSSMATAAQPRSDLALGLLGGV